MAQARSQQQPEAAPESQSQQQPEAEGRSARKRREIMAAATEVFLRNGYLGASMDQIASRAGVSKQTVYKHFADKEALFAEILRATVERAGALDAVAREVAEQDTAALADRLTRLARWLITFLLRPEVRQLRRLVIGEAGRFPALGRSWYEEGFAPGIAALASAFQTLAERGELHTKDPLLAADHFAGLVLWVPVNRVMFCGDQERLTAAEIDHYARAGVRAFLSAYGPG